MQLEDTTPGKTVNQIGTKKSFTELSDSMDAVHNRLDELNKITKIRWDNIDTVINLFKWGIILICLGILIIITFVYRIMIVYKG